MKIKFTYLNNILLSAVGEYEHEPVTVTMYVNVIIIKGKIIKCILYRTARIK